MAVRKITQYWEDHILEEPCYEINYVKDKEIQSLVTDMIDTKRSCGPTTVWLAAPQIWRQFKIFIFEIIANPARPDIKPVPLTVLINPEITESSNERIYWFEWCLSVAKSSKFARVKRPLEVTVEGINQHWEKIAPLKTKWLVARIIQHENDHLNWEVFLNKLKDETIIFEREIYEKLIFMLTNTDRLLDSEKKFKNLLKKIKNWEKVNNEEMECLKNYLLSK